MGRGFRQAVPCPFLLSPSRHHFGLLPELPGSRSALCDLVALSYTWLSTFKVNCSEIKVKIQFLICINHIPRAQESHVACDSCTGQGRCGAFLPGRCSPGELRWRHLLFLTPRHQTPATRRTQNASRVSIVFIWAWGRGTFMTIFHCFPQDCSHLQPSN